MRIQMCQYTSIFKAFYFSRYLHYYSPWNYFSSSERSPFRKLKFLFDKINLQKIIMPCFSKTILTTCLLEEYFIWYRILS